MRIYTLYLILILSVAASGFGLAGTAQSAPIDELILPRKTDLYISLQRSINSKTARPGDKFSAQISVPVTRDDRIVIPVGSYVLGHVRDAKAAGRLKGKGTMLLGFDTLILPDGVTRNIVALVDSAENYSPDRQSEAGKMEAPGGQGEEVAVAAAVGAATGIITGATVGALRNGTLKGAGVGGLAGAAGGALIGLLQRGEDVELPRGSALTIQLQEKVGFQKASPPPQGKRLQ